MFAGLDDAWAWDLWVPSSRSQVECSAAHVNAFLKSAWILFEKTLNSCITVLMWCRLWLGVHMDVSSELVQAETRLAWLCYAGLQGSWLLVVGARMTHGLEAENGGKQLPLSASPQSPFLPWAKPGLLLKGLSRSEQFLSLSQCGAFWLPIALLPLGMLLLQAEWVLSKWGSCYSTLADCPCRPSVARYSRFSQEAENPDLKI